MMGTLGRGWSRLRQAFLRALPGWAWSRGRMHDGGALLPSAGFDYAREAGAPEDNAAVSICLGWIGDNFPEATLVVTGVDGRRLADHPLPALVRRPNPAYDGDALLAATAMSYAAHGNAYWLKVRDGAGRPRELWFIPHWQIEPEWSEDGRELPAGYVYRSPCGEYLLPGEDVVHIRFGIDPVNPRLGISRLRAISREIYTDNEAATYMAALLRNTGVPSVMVTNEGADLMSREEVEALRAQLENRARGEARGMPVVCGPPLKMERLAWGPEDMALREYRQVPEDRICAALRLNPMVVGLTSGVAHKTYANYAEARRAAYEDCLVPMQRRLAAALDVQLLPELGRPGREQCGWDYSRIQALRDELTQLYARNTQAVQGGWMSVNEARLAVGLPPLAGGDALRPALDSKGENHVPASA